MTLIRHIYLIDILDPSFETLDLFRKGFFYIYQG
jgi:hypothetical protein